MPNDSRHVLHLDLDAFFVSVERLKEPSLVGKPVLVGGLGDRAVVAACSYETRRFGVRSAMPMRLARRLCPDAIVLKGDWEKYSQYSDAVTEIITERAPIVEKASVDEFYVDMTGMERFVGCAKWSADLKSQIRRQTGLTVTWGLAANKTVSKVAAGEAKPDGALEVFTDNMLTFLAPLDVGKLPGVGETTARTLRCMGVTRIGTLAQIPRRMMERAFGKSGVKLWEKANGIDLAPVLPYHRQKSLSKEMTFHTDTTDVVQLRATLERMTELLAFELRGGGWCAGKVTVKIRYADFQTHTRQLTIPPTATDNQLIAAALSAFQGLYDRRLLIRLVGVSFSKLVRGTEQLSLFEPEGGPSQARLQSLCQQLDRIRQRYGERSIGRASSFHLGI
ncbi:DNA polymerase IV [Tellurirhabdus rosea]|uniref:DNA polymerase IV n=1 Tax=Tellurirhabdus rosea TaxID=2674997 RepID=UPI00225787AD|nr:DNA polymerase IV [Tellurirhabdus rosea]